MSEYQFAGYGRPIDGFCEMPARMVPPSNPDAWYWSRCGSSRPSKCEPCAEVKRRDVAAVGRSGWSDRPAERGYWVTLTAPGSDVLPWDTSKCRHGSALKCSGKIGCKVDADKLAHWHESVAQRWSWFVTELRRELGCDVQFFKTWEEQDRGALHAHSMMRACGAVTARRFEAAVLAAATRWGFGDQIKCDPVDLGDSEQAARVAGYCAKYATKSADGLPSLRRLNRATGEIRTGGFRSWSASRRWGDTMAAVRLRRCQWAASMAAATACGGAAAGDGDGGALDSYQGIYAAGVPECVDSSSSALL